MKRILIIAGPNGAGKTTFAQEFLPNEDACPEFVNADLIAAGLSPFQPEQVAFTAGRLMLNRIDQLTAAERSFAFETTLATRSYLRMIPQWQHAGYTVRLCFFKLPDPEFAIRRVAQRVALGGHAIPEAVIRRRYTRGWENLINDYIGLVDTWTICDATQTPPQLIETGERPKAPTLIMEDPAPYPQTATDQLRANPHFAGIEAALQRASDKAIAKARTAGLEPVVADTGTIATAIFEYR